MNDMLTEGRKMKVLNENELNSSALIRRGDNSLS